MSSSKAYALGYFKSFEVGFGRCAREYITNFLHGSQSQHGIEGAQQPLHGPDGTGGSKVHADPADSC